MQRAPRSGPFGGPGGRPKAENRAEKEADFERKGPQRKSRPQANIGEYIDYEEVPDEEDKKS